MVYSIRFFSVVMAALLVGGCTKTKVERVPLDTKIDLSGEWNDYDAMQVAKNMVEDSLSARWLDSFTDTNKRDPVVIVGHVVNMSDEHVDSLVFTKYLERELINSGRVVFVASPEERTDIRGERDDQQKGYTDPETMKKIGKERGADFMMIGNLSSVKDAVKGKSVIYYQVNLELVNLETNEKVWIGRQEIKKSVKVSRFSL